MIGRLFIFLISMLVLISLSQFISEQKKKDANSIHLLEKVEMQDSLIMPGEKHFTNMRQLTFGGDNAEAYWSFDNRMLSYQYRNKTEGRDCDQIFFGVIPNEHTDFQSKMISTGKGRTTCAHFLPDNKHILYASTHIKVDTCLQDPDRSKGYLWGVYPSYEIFIADLNGNITQQLTDNNFYDAEATVSPKGDKIVFTSDRSGDLELWTMNMDGSNLQQITNTLGYDGGAFFSPDGSKIVFRASRPQTPEAQQEYKELLKQGFVRPNEMELFICNADGSNMQQLTNLGGANWAPFFHPSGNKIIFSSNHVTKRIPFNLFLINVDGSGLEQISFDTIFDSFPMFSFDGKFIVFGSNRNNHGTRDTNLFVAEWKD
ncbi:MAG: TolB family protein [Chitinophagales bacterium]